MVVSDSINFYLINFSNCHGGPFSNRGHGRGLRCGTK